MAIAASVFSALTSAYANYNAVQLGKIEAKSQASAFNHRARMLELDQRAAERRAESILEAGQSEVANVTLEAGQRQAAITADTATRGVEAGVGSAAEVMASEKLVAAMDVHSITLATVREANAARAGATALKNEALFARTSGINLRRSARAAQPEAQFAAGLTNAATSALMLRNYKPR